MRILGKLLFLESKKNAYNSINTSVISVFIFQYPQIFRAIFEFILMMINLLNYLFETILNIRFIYQ